MMGIAPSGLTGSRIPTLKLFAASGTSIVGNGNLEPFARMKLKLIVPLLLASVVAALAVVATPQPAAFPRCDPYAEKCPACKDCTACKACNVEKNRCSVCRFTKASEVNR